MAIPGLIRIVIGFTLMVYLLLFVNPDLMSVLDLKPAAVKDGEVWRLVSYIFIPRAPGPGAGLLSPLFLIIALWFLWFIGEGLERAWGAFRLTLYFIAGMIGTTVAAFVFGAEFSNEMLAASLFFAFARFYPEEIIYILFVLPVKIKWLAWFFAFFLLLGFVTGSNPYRMALVAAFSNYLIFFGPEYVRNFRHRRTVTSRRRRFEESSQSEAEPLHRCAICGATEQTDPSLEFRVARDGEEYCMPHLAQAGSPSPSEVSK